MVAQLFLPFLPRCTPSRLFLEARLSSSFVSKGFGVVVADDTLTYPRVLLLQLFIMGAQEPGVRFWVDKFRAGSPELCFVSLLSWVCFLPGRLGSSLGSAKWRLHLNPEHSGAKEQL